MQDNEKIWSNKSESDARIDKIASHFIYFIRQRFDVVVPRMSAVRTEGLPNVITEQGTIWDVVLCVCVHILKTHLFKVACRVEWAEKEWENTKIKHKSVSQLMGLAALQCGLITYRLILYKAFEIFC